MKRLLLFALLFTLAVPAPAQETAPPPEAPPEAEAKPAAAVLDDLSKKLMTDWNEKLIYRLGERGVKTATCTAKVDFVSQMGEMKAVADYKWDGKNGTLTWDNAMLGAQLAQQGMGVDTFNGHFRATGMEEEFGAGTFKATEADGIATITVTGSKAGYKSLVFKDGVLQHFVMNKPVMGKATDIKLSFTYRKIGEKYLISGWTVELELPGMGPFKETTTFTIGNVGEHHVWTASKSESAMGTRSVVFDWKLDPPADGAADGAK